MRPIGRAIAALQHITKINAALQQVQRSHAHFPPAQIGQWRLRFAQPSGSYLLCSRIAGRNVKGETMTNPLVRTLRNWRKYRQTYNELVRLTDRELDDLGIRRVDIRSIARDSLAR